MALLTPYPPAKDGIAYYSEQLSKAFDSIGIKVYVLTWADESDLAVNQEKVKVIKISPPTRFGFKTSMVEALSRLSPDVFHVQYSFRRGLYGRTLGEQLLPLFFAVHKSGLPIVVTVHDIWNRFDIFSRFGRNIVGMPKALAFNTYLHVLSKLMFRYADAIICHSSYFTDILENEYKIGHEKLFVVEHGVPDCQIIDNVKAKSMMNIRAKHVLLNFGTIWEAKGLEHLIQAMKHIVKEFPNVHLIIAGQPYKPRYFEKLRSLSEKIGLEKYISIHAKFIEEDKLPIYFSASSLVVAPYIYTTGVSGVVRMAFAFEKPVVASLNPLRIDELGLRENARGIVVPLGNPHQLAAAIAKLLRDDEFYEKLRQNIKAYKIETSWKNVATRTSEIYKKVLYDRNFGKC